MSNEEQRILNVVAELGSIVDALEAESLTQDPDSVPTNALFTYGDDWTLVFARGDRAAFTLDGVRVLYGLSVEDQP